MDNRFDKVIAVKQRSHRSWNNLHAAADKALGLPYVLGTRNVACASESYLSTAVSESWLSAAEIKSEMEKRGLLRETVPGKTGCADTREG